MDFDNEFIDEIRKSFLDETSELLENTEHCYLELEKDPENISLMQDIFRCVHTIKGGAAGVGLEELSRFSHDIENLLVKVKNNEIVITSGIVDILLKSNDRLSLFIENLKGDINAAIKTDDIVKTIKDAIKQSPCIENKDEKNRKERKKRKAKKSATLDREEEKGCNKDKPSDPSRKKLGEILVEQGLLDEEKLACALKIQAGEKTEAKSDDAFIRLPLSKIDNMLDYFGEQVILQSTLEYSRNDLEGNKDLIDKTILQLNKITYDLQQTAISLRMVSLKNLFNRARRIVRDTSVKVNKQVDFYTEGEDTQLDKTIMDELSGPLAHLLRNAVDHGIEDKETRRAQNKPDAGNITMCAFHKGGFFYLEIADDGQGLDPEKIRQKAVEKGLLREGQHFDDGYMFQLIMESGFSTKKEASDISGRGVGLDVVKTAIDKLHGSISINSKPGRGSCFIIRLPLTLALFNGFIVHLSGARYIFPNSEIKEICHIDMNNARRINDNEMVIDIKDAVIPVIDVKRFLLNNGKMGNMRGKEIMLIVNAKGRDFALLVDDIVGQQKIVLKKLGKEVEGIPGIAGGTILGDGKIALIVEINELVSMYQNTL